MRTKQPRWYQITLALLVYSVVYGGIAWLLAIYAGQNNVRGLVSALGFLAIVRLIVVALDSIPAWINWRLIDRRRFTDNYLEIMRNAKMPKRVYSNDDIGNYLIRISDYHVEYSRDEVRDEVQKAAQLLRTEITVASSRGGIAESRVREALNKALETYSPEDDSPHYIYGITEWIEDAEDKALSDLPHSSSSLVSQIKSNRPFLRTKDFYQLLRTHGLSRIQAVELMNAIWRCHRNENEKL